MTIMRRQLRMGENIPRGYGFAWFVMNQDACVYYPVPFNLLCRWAREAWWWIQNPGVDAQMKIWQRGFDKGKELQEGWLKAKCQMEYNRGLSDGRDVVFRDLLNRLDEREHMNDPASTTR